MNVNIKFKAWDKEKKRMSKPFSFYSAVIEWNDGDIDMPTLFAAAKDRVEWLQYTGRKDKNGTDIYGGDVYDIGICTKIIRPDHFIEDTHELMTLLDDGAVIKVLGNIYENSELLNL